MSSLASAPASRTPIWDFDSAELDQWVREIKYLFPPPSMEPSPDITARLQFVPVLWKNLEHALMEVKAEPVRSTEDPRAGKGTLKKDTAGEPARKKAKQERLIGFKLIDPLKLWVHIKEFETIEENGESFILLNEALPETLGAKLAEMSVAGIINGFAGVAGGVVDKSLNPIAGTAPTAEIPTSAGPCILSKIKIWAVSLHQSVKTRLEKDVLDTTPQRIAHMLAPDLSYSEFRAVRRRVYDTVMLGKGLKVEDTAEEVPVGNAQTVHDIEKFKKCKICGETDQSSFILDRKNGDVICSSCGTVHSESIMHEGSQFRKFEGEVDRNHHGDAGNPLLSSSYNMSTTLGGIQVTSGAGMGGFGSNQNKRGLETVLRNAHAFTELNVSSFGNSKDAQGRTRTGYKDKQKKQAFVQMNHVGDALNLHEAVVQRSKEIFAGFRDDRELLHQLKAVIAACMCEAFEQLAQDGRKILQQQETGTVEADEIEAKDKAEAEAKRAAFAKTMATNRRAVKRAEMHKASMAGKGGLFLDFSEVDEKNKGKKDDKTAAAAISPTNSRFEGMPVSTWELEDCRSWLLEASRAIAQSWVDERDALPEADGESNSNGGKPPPGAKKNFPKGSRDEIEGKLVEYSIVLCEFLEGQIKKSSVAKGGKRVVTPRVQDMSRLGIKWQHAHERGSGGKGGVGNSGDFKKRATAASTSGRRAGQVLILQSAGKLGDILKDPLAGESFHRELRALVGRQKARKDRELRDEASRQRLMQMKRKPWLQKKVAGGV